jgi:predicted ester cyclase
VPALLDQVLAPDCDIYLAHPFDRMTGPEALAERFYAPLLHAIPDLERREEIVVAGQAGTAGWIGCGGHYTGVFERPWLDIPPTGHIVTMRYCEFFRVEDGRVTALRALVDIPEVMMQAGAWPMAPSLGREYAVPGPATQDGLDPRADDPNRAAASLAHVDSMLKGLGRHAEEGPAGMQLDRHWHPRLMWYGPAGIGSGRRISGFRYWHQIPFLSAMPDRRQIEDTDDAFFAEGDYVAYCGMPALACRLTGDGWLGLAPSGQPLEIHSLDFWRLENGLIRENWVLVDLLHVKAQLGIDVLARMRAMTGRRPLDIPY